MIFAVLDVSLAVNLCINCSFLHLLYRKTADSLSKVVEAKALKQQKLKCLSQSERYTVNPIYLVQIKIYLTQIKNLFKNLTTQTLFVCNKYTY